MENKETNVINITCQHCKYLKNESGAWVCSKGEIPNFKIDVMKRDGPFFRTW